MSDWNVDDLLEHVDVDLEVRQGNTPPSFRDGYAALVGAFGEYLYRGGFEHRREELDKLTMVLSPEILVDVQDAIETARVADRAAFELIQPQEWAQLSTGGAQ